MKINNLKKINDTTLAGTIYGKYISKSEEETEAIAKAVAESLKETDIIVLTGDLGSGKTKFVYGLAKHFGIENQVSSPTFTIVNEYILKKDYQSSKDIQHDIRNIYHFDVYRLKDYNDFIDSIGLEYFDNGLCIIEWGEILQDILPKNSIYINIERVVENENYREISICRNI